MSKPVTIDVNKRYKFHVKEQTDDYYESCIIGYTNNRYICLIWDTGDGKFIEHGDYIIGTVFQIIRESEPIYKNDVGYYTIEVYDVEYL